MDERWSKEKGIALEKDEVSNNIATISEEALERSRSCEGVREGRNKMGRRD